jgi:hypothetical protein|nr:MAG TPA: hypothetical protein [Caudoviricetes sp.]
MIATKIATVKSDLIKFTEIMARENELPPFIVVGVLADILSDWKSKELVQVNDAYARRIKELNEEGEKDVQD